MLLKFQDKVGAIIPVKVKPILAVLKKLIPHLHKHEKFLKKKTFLSYCLFDSEQNT